jgi:serine/threonine protein kinase
MGVLKSRRPHAFIIPKRRVSPEEGIGHSKSIIRSIKREPPQHRTKQEVPLAKSKSLYPAAVKFFSGFTSSHMIRKKFGSQRIVQELQRNTQDNETYGGFFGKQDNWSVVVVPEMNPDQDLLQEKTLTYQPECLLGVGGQGCVFLGHFTSSPTKSYAFKIRTRTKSAINSGTSSSPGRRRSPNFRIVEGALMENGEDEKTNDFIDDMQQESLHREAVAAFRVHAKTQMNPRPILYGYSVKLDYEVFVMEIMDFTLNDFIKGTNWKTRMDCLGEVWTILKDSFDNCHAAGIVHYDIKPENLGIRITNGTLETGLLDFGISKTIGYPLDRYCRGSSLYRPPGTVTYMSPRSQVWKPMSWMDDFLSSFFTMYIYATVEGKSAYDKIAGVKKYKMNISSEDRKTMSPESLAVHCLRFPPWIRFPYGGSSHPTKKRQNETIVKEEISLAMLKAHAIANPRTQDDIISILLNIDGFLDDTMDLQGLLNDEEGEGRSAFTNQAVGTLRGMFTRSLSRFSTWWLEFAEEVRRLTDQFWRSTPEEKRMGSYQAIMKMLDDHVPNNDDVKCLIENSTCGRQLIETDF